MIPWDEFKTPQDAYEWTKHNIDGFKPGLLYLTPEQTVMGDSFFTSFRECGRQTEYIRIMVRR